MAKGYDPVSNILRYGELISDVAARIKKVEIMLFQIKEMCEVEGLELEALEKLDACESMLRDFLKQAHLEMQEKEEEGK
jgi:hypothetical protein